MFKRKSLDMPEETRPCTAVDNVRTLDHTKSSFAALKDDRRIQSANKTQSRYKEQYYFLFKEDIFD